jgi:hypothetical protein
MLDHQIKIAADAFGITCPEDWCKIRPDEIRAIHGCGPATVDHLRIYLAARGLTLRDDATPVFWQTNLSAARIGGQVSKVDTATVLPFTILVDTKEQQPFAFQGFLSDSDTKFRPLLVRTELKNLGPAHGDYAIRGMEGEAHIERKGVSDAIGTFLSQGERRERWLKTLEFLAGIECAAVVVECSFGAMLKSVESRGSRPVDVLRKTLHCQVLAWEQDYRVPFVFCDSRRFAELTVLEILKRYYRHATDSRKTPEEKQIDSMLEAIL